MTGLPRLPLAVRISLWSAFHKDPTVEVPNDVTCQVWGCTEWCVTKTWPPRLRRYPRRRCVHFERSGS